MNEILQGTTPTIKAKVPESVNISDIVAVELTIKNGGNASVKHLPELIADVEDNSYRYHFTEDETLALIPNSNITIQYRFKLYGGDIVGTREYKVPVASLISGAKIS